jgi:hypothetical protein
MKNILSALILAVFCIGLQAQTPVGINFTWTYAYTAPYAVACSSTVTTNCIQSFVLSQVGGATIQTIPATSATSYNYLLTTLPAPGNYTYSLVAVGSYQGGAINSVPATFSITVPGVPSGPASFTATLVTK